MYNHSISSLLSTALLSLTAALAPVWAQAPSNLPPAENSGLEKTLTGTVCDVVCKGWHNRKGQTNYSCSLQCIEDGADYVLVVAKTLNILQGHRTELDKFAGGRATVHSPPCCRPVTGLIKKGTAILEDRTSKWTI